jgi:S1-C subfamily serine protease
VSLVYVNGVAGQTTQQIARTAFSSTVLLVAEDADGRPLSLGSGFFIADKVIATNLHVIAGASRGYAKLMGDSKPLQIEGIVAIDAMRDLVLLKLPAVTGIALRIGDSNTLEVGDTVFAVGNPQGLEGTFSQGIVSGIRAIGPEKLLQITAPISPGSSGGPVLNTKGHVVGVSVATFRGGQNLNFAIPSNYLKTLLTQITSVRSLASIRSREDRRSILSDFGGPSTDGVVGTRLTYDSFSATGHYSFSLLNKLQQPVENIQCLVIFYDVEGIPLDVVMVKYEGVIPPGIAKRIAGRVDQSVERLNADHRDVPPHPPKGKIEFRVLNFQVTH